MAAFRKPSLPPNEVERLEILQACDILDTAPEATFDALTRLAAHICGTPMAFVSLVDANRQWFKSRIGFWDVQETPRDVAFCAHAILERDLMIIPDARQDPRFADHPAVVAHPHIRFYAGVPLTTSSGHRLGTLCAMDCVPRQLDSGQLRALRALAQEVTTQLELRRENRAMRPAQAHLESILNAAGEGIFGLDAAGFLNFVNPVATRMLGWEAQDLIGRRMHEVVHHSRADGTPYPEAQCPIYAAFRDGETHEVDDEVFWRKDGTSFPVRYTSTPMIHDGKVRGTVVIFQDITRHRRAEEALRDSEERLRALFNQMAVGVAQVDLAGRFLRVNQRYCDIVGRSKESLLEMRLQDISHPDDLPHNLALFKHAVAQGDEYVVEKRYLRPDGAAVWVAITASLIRSNGGEAESMVGIAQDITERKRAEERLHYLANYDVLTGLPNRTLFVERLQEKLAANADQRRQVAVLFFDLDQFKRINDTLGHDIGDLLLKATAERLGRHVHEADTVARLGGDEFAILLPDIARTADATRRARGILAALSKPFEVAGHALFITTSIGIALSPRDGENAHALLKNADTAMYAAKRQGENHYQRYSAAAGARASRRLEMENELRRALAREEFLLHYQPQIDLVSGRIVAVEALLRWRHPDSRRIRMPGEFIPLAEDSGLILPIGEWVLRNACAQNGAWRSQGFAPLRMAVNFSARQFHQLNMNKMVGRVLRENRLDPCSLELELTESVLQDHEAERVLRPLAGTGVKIAIDDFGTGYSSLSYLKYFSVDKLKIDRSFLRGVPRDKNNAALIEAIIAMARGLQLSVTAEGVENRGQLDFLHGLSCESAQGYLLGRPLSARSLTRRLAKNHNVSAPRG